MAYFLPSPRLYNFFFLLLFFCCCFFTLLINPTSSHPTQPTSELVESVCNTTTIYEFCVDALYSNPRTPTIHDPYSLAYISFTLAIVNATDARLNMQILLKSNSSRSLYSKPLRRCVQLYGEAAETLGRALNDMNSDDYYDLAPYAADCTRKADNCQAAFGGRATDSRLSRMNRDFRGLAEICIVVSNICYPG
ncbi:cell wall / vacuolar inhibitor of fructosidase 2-like [Rhododendron vialii]|uniref:cell wall / vacuolar inhibitor of fructosidase 2-like n=1 Tax=Rhododendron vialii TaxID=182163 RepID=UPI00265F3D06|nr:cell wall / vacuolar inhibitor of fructosidase 2-like [Rhododendron vialii]